MGERGIEAAVIAELLRRERQRQPEVQIPLELPLSPPPYWPEKDGESAEQEEDGKNRGVTIIKIYDDNDEEEQDMIRMPL